jgi:phosphate starvation-inducible PhoH-like protein
LGLGGKMIVSGDTDQTDISKSGLKPWANALKGVEGIGFVEFTEADIVRHPLVRKILAKRPK